MEKDVRFSSKKIDESWKQSAQSETPETPESSKSSEATSSESQKIPLTFSSFAASIGIQCLMQLGAIGSPEKEKTAPDLNAAQEGINLLVMLKEKTAGNLTEAEADMLSQLIADLQMKFVEQTKSHPA